MDFASFWLPTGAIWYKILFRRSSTSNDIPCSLCNHAWNNTWSLEWLMLPTLGFGAKRGMQVALQTLVRARGWCKFHRALWAIFQRARQFADFWVLEMMGKSHPQPLRVIWTIPNSTKCHLFEKQLLGCWPYMVAFHGICFVFGWGHGIADITKPEPWGQGVRQVAVQTLVRGRAVASSIWHVSLKSK